MKCFYHHDIDAVAICKSCQRGLCAQCAVDVPPGVACINKCEKDVEAVNTLFLRGKTAYQKTGRAYRRSALVTSIMGLLFTIIGMVPIIAFNNYGSVFIVAFGLIFLFWAYLNYRSAKQFESTQENA